MSFPKVVFGYCDRCGSKGADYPATELTTADAQTSLDTTGGGVELERYKGQWLCPLCVIEVKGEAISYNRRDKHAQAESFRDKAGFTNTIDT